MGDDNTDVASGKLRAYLVIPVVNSIAGTISFPSLSFGGEITNFARRVATTIQILAKPRYCPGQILFPCQWTDTLLRQTTGRLTCDQTQSAPWVAAHQNPPLKLGGSDQD